MKVKIQIKKSLKIKYFKKESTNKKRSLKRLSLYHKKK
jgi:hypothetical protein